MAYYSEPPACLSRIKSAPLLLCTALQSLAASHRIAVKCPLCYTARTANVCEGFDHVDAEAMDLLSAAQQLQQADVHNQVCSRS